MELGEVEISYSKRHMDSHVQLSVNLNGRQKGLERLYEFVVILIGYGKLVPSHYVF